MTAAIYARKSSDQSHVTDEQRSVTRQIDHARTFAARKGWDVSDDIVFVDDGIGGAEFDGLPGCNGSCVRSPRSPRLKS